MKRLLLAVLAVAALAATAAAALARPAQTVRAAATIKVGLVTDTGGLNDRGFNHLAYVGLQQAQKQLHVEGRVVESASSSDYIPNITSLARKGYDLVISVGYTETEAMKSVAPKFPKTHFAIVDVSNADLGGAKNVVGLLFREQEVGYLAGYLAGLEAKRLHGGAVSSVGGMKQPPVDRFIAGYEAGAKQADPSVKTLNGYSQDFSAQDKCKELALQQIALGSVVVFQVAGGCGLGALDAAREKHVWGVGVDADQSFLGSHILTSATKGVDRAVFLTAQDVVKNRFRGGRDDVFGLKVGGVALGKINPRVPPSEVAAVKRIEAEIIAGKIVNIPTTVK
jgi:basic membrane protein A